MKLRGNSKLWSRVINSHTSKVIAMYASCFCHRYMAAVQAAAAEAAKESAGKKKVGSESAPPSLQKAAAPAREREKLLERLRGVCEGGSVIPVPFLRAAHAVPSAILDDLRAPYVLHPAHSHALLVSQHCWWTRLHHSLLPSCCRTTQLPHHILRVT